MLRTTLRTLLVLAALTGSAQASHDFPPLDTPLPPLDPMKLSANGHYYDVVGPFDFQGVPPAISWESAAHHASEQTFKGVSGQLATVTSAAENDFIEAKILQKPECLRPGSVAGFSFELGPWIGGTRVDDLQNPTGTVDDFYWIDTLSPFSDMNGNAIGGAFTDWVNPPEPTGEPFVNYVRFSAGPAGTLLNTLGWADCNSPFCVGQQQTPSCYVIEFDVPREVPSTNSLGLGALATLLLAGLARGVASSKQATR